MVATNEFEDAWLDEGMNSYTEVKIMNELYGFNTSTIKTHFGTMGEPEQQRLGYLARPDADPIARFAWQYMGSVSYGGVTYGKTATMLLTLKKSSARTLCGARFTRISCATALRIRLARTF